MTIIKITKGAHDKALRNIRNIKTAWIVVDTNNIVVDVFQYRADAYKSDKKGFVKSASDFIFDVIR